MQLRGLRTLVPATVLVLAHIAWTEEAPVTTRPGNPRTKEVAREELLDRIHGGWAAMLIGGIQGLAHEFKYNDKPRDTLPDFPLGLPDGARTDDDNDFEWTHIYYMDKDGVLKIPYDRIVDIWKANMNTGLWCANLTARQLMDKGVVPPDTGDPARNKFASFNLSGQFCVESYGMIAPGMPQAAADIGLHYARIAVSGEPLQATQYWTSLISLNAFHDGSLEDALKAALKAVDPASAQAEVVQDALAAFHDNPADWKAARQLLHRKWLVEKKWNGNSTPTNGAMVILALLYGNGDFYKSLQYSMALGHDADCNAATAGSVLGVRMGFKKIAALPGFTMPDIYKNLTRPALPREMKVSEQAETLLRVCEKIILANGGERIEVGGKPGFRIRVQEPRLLEPMRGK
ncbi:MAG: ADP-ribosylglycohydrolase family protein [Planctomycetota bacterium]|nr:ADP-ribosylglycohydrolase family protein [Planctomycetota bacterium]